MGGAGSDTPFVRYAFRRMLVRNLWCKAIKLYRGKVTRSWRWCSREEHRRPRWSSKLDDFVLSLLFFVRVNQVLVRLWARAMEAALCVVFVPLLRLMSDRESVSFVSAPRFGF